jgi:hypothetical protein
VQQVGKVILAMVPEIYDYEREWEVEDETGKIVAVRANLAQILRDNKVSIMVDSGPSYETRRKEATAALLQLSQSLPEDKKAMLLDVVVEQLDIPNKGKVLERVKGLIGLNDEVDPQAQMALQAAEQTINTLQQTIGQAGQIITQLQSMLVDKDKELQVKLEIERMKAEKDLAIAQIREAGLDGRKIADIQAEFQVTADKIMADSAAQETQLEAGIAKEIAGNQLERDKMEMDAAKAIIGKASARVPGPNVGGMA